MENAGNSISKPLDFKIFWGSMPPDPPSDLRLQRWRALHLYYPFYGTDKCSIWSLMKKRKLNTWKSTTKTLKVKINENVVQTERGSLALCSHVCGGEVAP